MQKLNNAIQEALTAIICYHDDGARVLRGMLSPRDFDPFYRHIVSEAYGFLDNYDTVPSEHTIDIIETCKESRSQDADVYDSILHSLQTTKDTVNLEYALDHARRFIRYQRLKQGVLRASEELQRGTEEATIKAESVLRESIENHNETIDPGVNVTDPDQFLRFLDEDSLEVFPCGIDVFDRRGIGPARKQLFIFGAPTGRGKTWYFQWLMRHYIQRRIKAACITLELSEDDVCARLSQCFFSVTKRQYEDGVPVIRFKKHGEGSTIRQVERMIRNRPSLRDDDIHSHLVGKMRKLLSRPPLFVKEFPTGSLTIEELEGYLDFLEARHRFIPDVLLIDYADLMQTDMRNYRRSVADLYTRLRGLAVKRNIAVVTASQLNKQASQKTTVAGSEHLAEAYAKADPADWVFTYNQTPEERERGLARIHIAKGRNEEDRLTVLLSQAYAIGQFKVDEFALLRNQYPQPLYRDTDEEDED